MQSCWHSDPNKRPTAAKLQKNVENILFQEPFNKTKSIISTDIGPRITHSIYKSGSLSAMVESVESTRSLKVQVKALGKISSFMLTNKGRENFASGFCAKGKDLQADIMTQVQVIVQPHQDGIFLSKFE
uniref:Serine-threonine/tyrosine-protein kinase catalytic domain-containing protein n=1 Tax=Rhizophagus irregularis (strain DAOM 181602 / DAOM 197198 / MUCL 43194) TaxID=747089 RepID=U9TU30_RHIID